MGSLRLIIPLVSFGTPRPNKQYHNILHFQTFLNEIFNVAWIKITVFKIKSQFTVYSSVISSLSIILTDICIFSKTFKQMQVLQKQKEICIFSACVLHSVKCWYIFYCNTELFLNKQKDHQVYEGLDGGVWNSLISKNLAHYSLSLKCLLIL